MMVDEQRHDIEFSGSCGEHEHRNELAFIFKADDGGFALASGAQALGTRVAAPELSD
jgi:hypothetical protein